MNEFTSNRFIILLAVIFPLMLIGAAIYLQSNICIIISVLVWMGAAMTMLYLPQNPNNSK